MGYESQVPRPSIAGTRVSMRRVNHNNQHDQRAERHGENPVLCCDQRKQGMHSVQVGDRLRRSSGGSHGESVQHNDIPNA